MIARLKGILEETAKDSIVVDVGGVGYLVRVSEGDLRRMPRPGDAIIVETHTHVREDAFDLYGFLTRLDRELFIFVMEANGVGPKLALTVLSHLDGGALLEAIRSGDIRLLSSVPGIGKKKAERIVLELRDKCEKRFGAQIFAQGKTARAAGLGAADANAQGASLWSEDLLEALLGLGYKEFDVRRAMAAVAKQEAPPKNLESYLKECLRFLSQNNARAISGQA